MYAMKVITETNVVLLERAVNEWIAGNKGHTILGLQTAQGQGIDPNNNHTFMTTILYAADLYEAEGTAAADGLIYGLRSTVRTPESS